ncbi:hypothetical protein KKH23_08920 [Patescibacteria group bacterium]|nr:hypothetical protein [Patescibacteria group bacterium]
MDYIGRGKFKCPECGLIEDLNEVIFRARLHYEEVEEEGEKYPQIRILEPFDDKRLVEFVYGEYTLKHSLEEDLNEMELWENHKLGIFYSAILYNWYRCSYEYNEWDLDLEIIKEIELTIENPSPPEGVF